MAVSRAPAAKRATGAHSRPTLARAVLFALCLGVAMLMFAPLLWLVRSSFMDLGQIFVFPPEWIPHPWLWSNYPEAFTTVPFLSYLLNTLTIVIPTIIGTLISTSLAAFGFSRLRWAGRESVFAILLATLMLPYIITLIPTFLLWSRIGLTNTFWPLILPHWFGADVFYIFLLRQFFRGIPRELDEAAILDGAHPLQVFRHIILPLSRPALIVVAILSGLGAWNDFLDPLVYLSNSDHFTLALGLAEFTGLYTSQWHLLMAASTMVIVPVVIVFFLAQKHFTESVALAGVKG